MQLWASFGTKAFWWPEGGASTPHHAMLSSTIICPTAFFLSSSFLLLCFCCWVLFFGSNPFFCSEPNGTAPRFCPKDFPCPRGTTRKANITGVVCPSGTCTAQDCCVSIYTCVCLGVSPPILTSRFMPCHFLSASGIAFLFLFRELVSPSIELAGRPFKYLLRLMGRSDMDCDDCMSGPFLGVVLTPF